MIFYIDLTHIGAIMKRLSAFAAFFLFAAAAPSSAQNATATARLGPGQSVTVTAAKATGDSASLEIALPKGAQRFDGIGEQFLSMKFGGRDSTLVITDLNGDGIDEIVVRGSVPPSASAIIVYKWDAQRGEYVPADFTTEQDEEKPFLFADAKSPVIIEKGVIEVRIERVDQSGRTASFVERYKWNGDGLHYSADN
jgi:hypothetical protein